MVLAYIIEHISKEPLGDYIKENIFVKADMHESVWEIWYLEIKILQRVM